MWLEDYNWTLARSENNRAHHGDRVRLGRRELKRSGIASTFRFGLCQTVFLEVMACQGEVIIRHGSTGPVVHSHEQESSLGVNHILGTDMMLTRPKNTTAVLKYHGLFH
ncbi:hypothetical protein KCU67_g57, partial [Aureobasidium melanogenum]